MQRGNRWWLERQNREPHLSTQEDNKVTTTMIIFTSVCAITCRESQNDELIRQRGILTSERAELGRPCKPKRDSCIILTHFFCFRVGTFVMTATQCICVHEALLEILISTAGGGFCHSHPICRYAQKQSWMHRKWGMNSQEMRHVKCRKEEPLANSYLTQITVENTLVCN